MDSITLMRQKYQALAQSLGDVEFQIHLLSEERDKIRHSMRELDKLSPDIQNLEKFLKSHITSLVKESYEKKQENKDSKGSQDRDPASNASPA